MTRTKQVARKITGAATPRTVPDLQSPPQSSIDVDANNTDVDEADDVAMEVDDDNEVIVKVPIDHQVIAEKLKSALEDALQAFRGENVVCPNL
jgi:hypothetical protein